VNTLAENSPDISRQVLAFIAEGMDQPRDDTRFNDLALELFAYQFERNDAYRNFCLRRDATPRSVGRWGEVPAVPTAAFKELPMTCFPPEEATVTYRSSGTTGTRRSEHHLRSLELYNASLEPNFVAHVLPDRARMRMLVLAPPPPMLPQSSLGHMLEVALVRWGIADSGYYLDESGLQRDRLVNDLRRAERDVEPVCLLGTAFAFVHLLDHCAATGIEFALPQGSRIMDTGGYKGRSREVDKAELYGLYETVLGVPQSHVVNEYGMTEMGSQFYDTALHDKLRGIQRPRHKMGPPWARTVIVDPETMTPAGPGSPGLLRHYDLSNVDSVMALQTDDLGYEIDDGFESVGRAQGAEARGCSITIDELLSTVPDA
jgi:hypothetical protein